MQLIQYNKIPVRVYMNMVSNIPRSKRQSHIYVTIADNIIIIPF